MLNSKGLPLGRDALPFAPLDVRINEARLVENMVPVSKMIVSSDFKYWNLETNACYK